MEPFKVLIVDDDDDARVSIQDAVRSLGHPCACARDGAEAWDMYRLEKADIVISDWKMPRMDGVHLCRMIRESDSTHGYSYFIFVTGNDDKFHALEGMRAGADEYLTKPLDIEQLGARLEVARRLLTVHRGLRDSNIVLRRESERALVAARTDALTAAFNRLALTEDLDALAARAVRYKHRYCAALCDIDDFKAYNDCFGHLAGDDVLRTVAHTIHGELRRGDGFYRYGGEEFLALLPEQTLAEASIGMERVRAAVESLRIPHAPKAEFPYVTISVGIASFGAESAGSLAGWLQRSDAALYAAKALGRNRVEVDTEEPISRRA